ncbi:hypothetical protein ACQJBY_047090 [Aegilops geniculata]
MVRDGGEASCSLSAAEKNWGMLGCSSFRTLWTGSHCCLLEEFAYSVEQPDPVPLVLMRATEAACGETVNSKDAPGCGQQVGSDEAIGRHGGARRRADAPTRSAQSTDRVNLEAPGWTKRLRLGSAPPDRALCPSRMSALEKSILKYAEEPTKSVVRPTLGLTIQR